MLLPHQLLHLCCTVSHIIFKMLVCRHSLNTAQMQILIDTLAGTCDIHKITFIRIWYRMPGGIMPLGYNFWEFVAINWYITSDIVIISALCLQINSFYTIYGFTLSPVLKIRPHITHNISWILYKPVGTLKTIYWIYMSVCAVVVILRLELKSVFLLRGIEMRSIQLT